MTGDIERAGEAAEETLRDAAGLAVLIVLVAAAFAWSAVLGA